MAPGMAGQQHMMQPNDPQAMHANQLLINNGINPGNLSDSQFASFQNQNPSVQQKSIQVYAQNISKHQRDGMKNAGGMSDGGSPIMGAGMDLSNPDNFFAANPGAAQQMRNAGMLPNGQPNSNGSNHALQDYQMQLMLLEQQNKKRLLMARQEQDTNVRPEGQPGMPGQAGFGAPGMSPQGSRGGPSPQPGDPARRGTPKLVQPGMPGSPMPDGRMTGSPAVMNFNNLDPAMYGQVNGRMQPPPSSNPAFNGGQIPPQQMEAMQRAQAGNRMPNGQWQQGPQGQAPMMQQGQPGQPAQIGTPQQRTDMPPPQGVPAAATANGRPGSPAAAPPTPQTTNKANPKTKKDPKAKKPAKKNSTASVAATPAAEGENPPATPTPSTPITPQHQHSFAKNDAAGQGTIPNANGAGLLPGAPQVDPNNAGPFGAMDGTDVSVPDHRRIPSILTFCRTMLLICHSATISMTPIYWRILISSNSSRAMLSASKTVRSTPIQASKRLAWRTHERVLGSHFIPSRLDESRLSPLNRMCHAGLHLIRPAYTAFKKGSSIIMIVRR